MTERWLITGGSGFIGTNLLEALAEQGHDIVNIDVVPPIFAKQQAYWRTCSLLDRPTLSEIFSDFKPDHVVHLAARTDLAPGDGPSAFDANTLGVTNMLAAVRAAGSVRRLIVASSMLVCRLGYQPRHDRDYCPTTAYGRSKVTTETLVREAIGAPPWILIRPTTIWGPWHVRLRDDFLKRLRAGRYVHPARECRRSYGYVGNVVQQIRRFTEVPEDRVAGKTFYVGDEPISLSAYVDAFSRRLNGGPARRVPYGLLKCAALVGDGCAALGWKGAPLTSYRLSNMTCDHVLDMQATLAVTGPPQFGLEEGVERTCAWLASP